MSARMIRVTIPTYNSAADLDRTVQSVLKQDYDQDYVAIIFADFGSTDDTLKKIMSYRRERSGVFSLAGRRLGRTMTAAAHSLWAPQATPGYPIMIRPGDILYPHCFSTCVRWYKRLERQRLGISYIVAETDIQAKDGSIRKQSPLFSKPCRLRAHTEDNLEYVKHGFRHGVMTFGRNYSCSKDKPSTLQNLDFWWNRLAYAGFWSNVLYLPETLGCMQEPEPVDELDELLFSFEQALTMFRLAKELPDINVSGNGFEPACRKGLAEYALWRSFLLHRQGKAKDAEDCFLLARVMSPAAEMEPCWQNMERLISRGDTEAAQWLVAFFAREEAPAAPKYPVGGMLTLMWQKIQQYCSGEKKSRFSD